MRVHRRPGRRRTTRAEDADLKANVTDPLIAYKAALAANIIGTTEVAARRRQPEPDPPARRANLGDLVADGFRFAANRTAAADGRPVANIAFSNGGGIRTSIAGPGNINEKSTFDVLPFDNVIVTVPNVTPAKLKELMEWGVAALPAGDGKLPADQRLQDDRRHRPSRRRSRAGSTVTTPGQRIRD